MSAESPSGRPFGRARIPSRGEQALDQWVGDLVYKVQKWPRSLFKREAAPAGFLHEALKLREEGAWPALCRELFGRLYGIGTTKLDAPAPGNEWAEELHRQADTVAEWNDLMNRVKGDSWRAAMGAAQVAHVLANHMPALPLDNVSALQAQADLMRDLGAEEDCTLLQSDIDNAQAASQAAVMIMQQAQGYAIRSALRRAAQRATAAIAEVEEGISGLGAGEATTPMQRRAMGIMLRQDERLRRIAALAGRLRVQAARKQRTKIKQERREVIAVTKGDDLQRLLACEAGLLSSPVTRPFVLERIAEKRALQYELGGKATKTRGPIVFLIDKSGSMQGLPDEWAKACGLAMMEVARIQNRPFACAFFSHEIIPSQCFFFVPGESTQERTMAMLSVQPDGGTDIRLALEWAYSVISGKRTERWAPGPDSDVVLITDGVDGSDVKAPAALLRAQGASIYTVCIECHPTPDIKEISVETVTIVPADMAGASGKLDGIFSV